MTPRPFRNNNPGDLEAGDHWQGLMPVERLTEQQKHERFAVFETPEWGFRAFVVVLRNYKVLYGANTVAKIVARFAPPTENNTSAYANFVCERMSELLDQPLKPTDSIDITAPTTMFAAVKAMATDETGSWAPYWTDAQLTEGMHRAGCEMPILKAAA